MSISNRGSMIIVIIKCHARNKSTTIVDACKVLFVV